MRLPKRGPALSKAQVSPLISKRAPRRRQPRAIQATRECSKASGWKGFPGLGSEGRRHNALCSRCREEPQPEEGAERPAPAQGQEAGPHAGREAPPTGLRSSRGLPPAAPTHPRSRSLQPSNPHTATPSCCGRWDHILLSPHPSLPPRVLPFQLFFISALPSVSPPSCPFPFSLISYLSAFLFLVSCFLSCSSLCPALSTS